MHKLKFILISLFSLLFILGCGSSNNSSNGGSGDITESVSYTVSFNGNGGTGLMERLLHYLVILLYCLKIHLSVLVLYLQAGL